MSDQSSEEGSSGQDRDDQTFIVRGNIIASDNLARGVEITESLEPIFHGNNAVDCSRIIAKGNRC